MLAEVSSLACSVNPARMIVAKARFDPLDHPLCFCSSTSPAILNLLLLYLKSSVNMRVFTSLDHASRLLLLSLGPRLWSVQEVVHGLLALGG